MKAWQKLEQAVLEKQLSQKFIDKFIGQEIWKNNIYTVFVRRGQEFPGVPCKMTWLSIKRNDKEPIRDWRHLQWIKNQLVGNDCEGVEIFPAEGRLVDSSNQYHLWVLEDPEREFPFGFHEGRMISEKPLEGGKIKRRWRNGGTDISASSLQSIHMHLNYSIN